MRRIWTVARREYLERVRSRAFIIGTVLAPVIMSAFMVVPALMMRYQHGKALRISVVDATGRLRGAVEKALEGQRSDGRARFEIVPPPAGPLESVLKSLRDRVVAEDLDGFVVLPADALDASRAEYRARNVAGFVDVLAIRSAVEGVVVKQRLASAGFDADRVSNLTRGLDLATIRLTESGAREDRGATMILAVILVMLIYTSVLMWGTVVMNGVI
jgi:ABC-2 type transport system permease protein